MNRIVETTMKKNENLLDALFELRDRYREQAEMYSFMLDRLGVVAPNP